MSRFNKQSSNNKKSPHNAGFYIALAVCLATIGASVWSAADSIISLRGPVSSNRGNAGSSAEQVGNPVSGVPYDSSSEETASQKPSVSSGKDLPSQLTPAPDTSSDAAETNRPITPVSSGTPSEKPSSSQAPVTNTTYIMPVSGRIIKPFSQSAYSQTFDDWRAHLGVDIAAKQGANVMAIGNGRVMDVYADDMLGTVVAVAHDSLEVYYCGLGSNPSVKAGEEVMCGQVLGVVKDMPSECVEESHLHLQVKKDGEWVEPLAAIGKEDQLPSESA